MWFFSPLARHLWFYLWILRLILVTRWQVCPYHAPPCAVPVIDENTRLLFISSGQCSAHGLRQAWRKEREEKKSFFPSHWGQTQEQVVLGGSLPSMRDSYCCSEGWGAFEHALVWWRGVGGRVGEKFEFLLSYVTATGAVTKRHFDSSYMGQESCTTSPWWLRCMYWDAFIIINLPTEWFTMGRFWY